MQSDTGPQIAFLGAGAMGAPMIRRLLAAGFSIRVWNRTAARADALVSDGAVRANSPAQAADGVDVVLACLSDATALEAALFAPVGGVTSAKRVPKRLIDFSTIGPQATRQLAGRLSAYGTTWVDAPVSGGAQGAEQGRLVIFCGGSDQDIDWAQPIFTALAQRVSRVGELGTGQTLKLCNQVIVAVNLVVIAEALTLAQANGLDPKLLPAALAGGFADSLPMQIFGKRMAEGVLTPVVGRIALMLKDLDAAKEMASVERFPGTVMNATLGFYREAVEGGLADHDLAALYDFAKSRIPTVSGPHRR
jgi:3-hydroxyisobutyrate dehydrogenase